MANNTCVLHQMHYKVAHFVIIYTLPTCFVLLGATMANNAYVLQQTHYTVANFRQGNGGPVKG